jgi:hypothetical protein
MVQGRLEFFKHGLCLNLVILDLQHHCVIHLINFACNFGLHFRKLITAWCSSDRRFRLRAASDGPDLSIN